MLKIPLRARPRKLRLKVGGGPEVRINRLRLLITGLFRYERLETVYTHCDETRGYAERLIHLAIRNGSRDKETMEMADYWLRDKDLIPKLFEVLVPRYENSRSTSFTSIYRLPTVYPGDGHELGIVELRGNPWPSVRPKKRDTRYLLPNILLNGARRDYRNGNLNLNVPGAPIENILRNVHQVDITGHSQHENGVNISNNISETDSESQTSDNSESVSNNEDGLDGSSVDVPDTLSDKLETDSSSGSNPELKT